MRLFRRLNLIHPCLITRTDHCKRRGVFSLPEAFGVVGVRMAGARRDVMPPVICRERQAGLGWVLPKLFAF